MSGPPQATGVDGTPTTSQPSAKETAIECGCRRCLFPQVGAPESQRGCSAAETMAHVRGCALDAGRSIAGVRYSK